MSPLRRTKIIATLGPSSNNQDVLLQMINAGLNVVRINFSHGNEKDRLKLIETARAAAQLAQKEIGIIADLQGPKIRIGTFQNGQVELKKGNYFTLNCDKNAAGDTAQVGVEYKALFNDVNIGDTLLLDDGLIELLVIALKDKCIQCQIVEGGVLSNHKGINLKGGGLSTAPLTTKDKKDIQQAVKAEVDYIALSFTRNAKDIFQARQLIQEAGGNTAIIAKIERSDALEHLDEIIQAADSVMVARGDLGIEIGLAEVPFVQKDIINRARALDKTVITATQMMESMCEHPQATRAEVSDVANAVLDGTDAVMLSAETAVGKYPVKVIGTVHDVCLSAEKHPATHTSKHRVECLFKRTDEAVAMAAMYTANHYPIKAIITLTESGASPLWMSRIRSSIPIFALSRYLTTQRKVTLFRGVFPYAFDPTSYKIEELKPKAVQFLKEKGHVKKGELIILTKGVLIGDEGGTNSMHIITV